MNLTKNPHTHHIQTQIIAVSVSATMFFLEEIHLEMYLHSTLTSEFACPPYPKMLSVFQLRIN